MPGAVLVSCLQLKYETVDFLTESSLLYRTHLAPYSSLYCSNLNPAPSHQPTLFFPFPSLLSSFEIIPTLLFLTVSINLPFLPNMKISSSPLDLNSKQANAAGCLSGILRRLLCRDFHHSALSSGEELGTDHLKQQEVKKPPPSPGLVARLMGLDSMPVHPYAPTESIRRSRSASSAEGWNGILSGQNKNRAAAAAAARYRTSQSFREEPTFLRKESDDFLVLSFGPDEKGEGFSSVEMKHKIDRGELKELKTRKRIKGKENVNAKSQNCSEISNSNTLQKKKLYREEANKESSNNAKKQRGEPRRPTSAKKRSVSALKKKVESESSSQDSSPVSVLDCHLDIEGECLTGPDSRISEEYNKPKQEKPRRKLSPELKSDSYPAAKTEVIRNSKDGGLNTANNAASSRGKSSERKNQVFSDTWCQICQLAGDDLKRSCWNFRLIWRSEDNGEIATIIGLEILDSLVNQVLTELLSTCSITV